MQSNVRCYGKRSIFSQTVIFKDKPPEEVTKMDYINP